MPELDLEQLHRQLAAGTLRQCPLCQQEVKFTYKVEWMTNEQTEGHEGWYKQTMYMCSANNCGFHAGFAEPYLPPAPPQKPS